MADKQSTIFSKKNLELTFHYSSINTNNFIALGGKQLIFCVTIVQSISPLVNSSDDSILLEVWLEFKRIKEKFMFSTQTLFLSYFKLNYTKTNSCWAAFASLFPLSFSFNFGKLCRVGSKEYLNLHVFRRGMNRE